VKKLVITSSVASLVTFDDLFKEETTVNEKSEYTHFLHPTSPPSFTTAEHPPCTKKKKGYNTQTAEDALASGAPGFPAYSISKSLADSAVRDFKRAHPEFDITTLHPSYIYGPLGRGQVYNSVTTGTNRYVYALISGAPDRPVGGYDPAVRGPPMNVDVRDVARAHVLALKNSQSSSSSSSDTPKRYIISSSTFTWKEAIELLAEARPELKGRLPVITGKEAAVGRFATLDTSATAAELGLKNYFSWQDTVLDTVDDLLRVEKELAAHS
jgi:nucleoside-diphosphate-sugar epimerase